MRRSVPALAALLLAAACAPAPVADQPSTGGGARVPSPVVPPGQTLVVQQRDGRAEAGREGERLGQVFRPAADQRLAGVWVHFRKPAEALKTTVEVLAVGDDGLPTGEPLARGAFGAAARDGYSHAPLEPAVDVFAARRYAFVLACPKAGAPLTTGASLPQDGGGLIEAAGCGAWKIPSPRRDLTHFLGVIDGVTPSPPAASPSASPAGAASVAPSASPAGAASPAGG